MTTTVFLAQIIGFVIFITSISMMLKRKMILHIFEDLAKNRALSYFFGILELSVGYWIFTNHTLWSGATEIIISIIGIALMVEALMYIFFSKRTLEKMFKSFTNKDLYYTMALLNFFLGGYLLGSGLGIF